MTNGRTDHRGLAHGFRVVLPIDAPPELRWVVSIVRDRLVPRAPMEESGTAGSRPIVTFTDGVRCMELDAGGFGRDGYGELVITAAAALQDLSADCVPELAARRRWTALVPHGVGGYRRSDHVGCLGGPSLGIIFECLTCLYEQRSGLVDGFGRPPRHASGPTHHAGGLRPIADEHVRLIGAALEDLWPGITVSSPEPPVWLTCDVDHLRDPSIASAAGAIRRAGAVALRFRDDVGPLAVLGRYAGHAIGRRCSDPYQRAVRVIMDLAERMGSRAQFFFIPFPSDPVRDRGSSFDREPHRSIALEIAARGHDLGIHPGFATYRDPAALARCVDVLHAFRADAGMAESEVRSRQHYLRWDHACTPAALDAAGVNVDSTLGYASGVGFRCGTSRRFRMFDVATRRPLRVHQAPLIAMDVAFLPGRRSASTDVQALEILRVARGRCHEHGGTFTCLWHNSELSGAASRSLMVRSVGLDDATTGP